VAAVTVDDLTVRFDDVTAVDGVSFGVEAGEVLALLGPNGAGKTSTIETLEGFRAPTSGRVRVLGLDPVVDHRELVTGLGAMLQQGGVYPGARPLEMLELYASFYDAPLDPADLLARVGLADKARRTWRQLSGGEQQRLSLALCLIGRPDVVLLDEPTAGVDVSGRQVVRAIVRELRDAGVAVLITTHDLDEAERIADRLVIIDRGHIVATGTVAELMAGGDRIRFGAPPGLDVDALSEFLGAAVHEATPGEYVVAAEGSPTLVASLAAWLAEQDIALGDLRAGRQRLEDVFLQLTEETSVAEPDVGSRRSRRRNQ
jgi:ABC-2 type transport system ATP-binding protein